MGEKPKRPSVTRELEAELGALIGQGNKVSATKRLRAATGAGLAEAKGWVDDYLDAHYGNRRDR